MPNGLPESFDPDRKYTGKEFAEIATILKETIFKNNPSGTTPTNNPPYGPYFDQSAYGPFSIPGFRPGMFSAFMRPRTIASQFGVQRSLNTNEKIGIMTGVTAGSGSNPTDFCGTAPTAGQLKRCIQNYVWGWSYWKTQVVDLMHVGERIDYSDYVDHNLMNQRAKQNPFVPDIMGSLDLSNRNEITIANELFTIGVEQERSFERVLIKGNVATAPASTQRGWIKEFAGLEQQIVTGKKDLDTQVVCPGADSVVSVWGTGVDKTIADGRNIVQFIRDTLFGLNEIGRQVGMEGVTYGIVMPFRMFVALTYVWACNYWTYACAGSTSNPSYTNAEAVRTLQLDMQNNYYLLIDGNRFPVFPSDGITETNASSTVITADDLFILPLEWNDIRLLNLHYKALDSQDILSFANYGGLAPGAAPINNGMYLMAKNIQNFCLEYVFGAKFRMIQEAPFLAAQLNTFQYSFLGPNRSPYPDSTGYHKDGGASRWDGNMSVLGA